MSCIACEEARRAAHAFYDKMAAAIRGRIAQQPPQPKIDPERYRDKPWVSQEEQRDEYGRFT